MWRKLIINVRILIYDLRARLPKKQTRLKAENYLLNSFQEAGFGSAEILKLSTMLLNEPKLRDHLRNLLKVIGR